MDPTLAILARVAPLSRVTPGFHALLKRDGPNGEFVPGRCMSGPR